MTRRGFCRALARAAFAASAGAGFAVVAGCGRKGKLRRPSEDEEDKKKQQLKSG